MTLFCLSLLTVFSGVLCSNKKGVAVPPETFKCADLHALNKVHWWYTWREYESGHCQNVQTHIPMIWGWRQNIDYPFHVHQSNYVLGFNEPNFHSQANLTPQQAAEHWRLIEKAFPGRYLVSPSAAPCGGPPQCYSNGEKWFEEFFQSCVGCKVDAIATHGYWCSADTMMHYLESLYNKFHRKIWLTEFACPQRNTDQDQLDFLKAVLPRLEAAHYVERYAWFASRTHGDGWVPQAASLLEQSSSKLTSVGEYYNNF